MKEQPILGYDWEMGHEEIKLEIGTYYTGKGPVSYTHLRAHET